MNKKGKKWKDTKR